MRRRLPEGAGGGCQGGRAPNSRRGGRGAGRPGEAGVWGGQGGPTSLTTVVRNCILFCIAKRNGLSNEGHCATDARRWRCAHACEEGYLQSNTSAPHATDAQRERCASTGESGGTYNLRHEGQCPPPARPPPLAVDAQAFTRGGGRGLPGRQDTELPQGRQGRGAARGGPRVLSSREVERHLGCATGERRAAVLVD
jgi:hypothetical protein